MRIALLCLMILLTGAGTSLPAFSLSPTEVLVVYNNSDLPLPGSQYYDVALQIIPASRKLAVYYANQRGIPEANLLGLSPVSFTEWIPQNDEDRSYVDFLAMPIASYLSTHPQIKCIVLCYGVPSRILTSAGYYSVDSALTLLGNPGTPSVRHWGLGKINPYHGKNVDFGTFRDSAENAIEVGEETWKMNYLVCRLDGFSSPADYPLPDPDNPGQMVNVPRYVGQMIDRGASVDPGGAFVLDGAPSHWPGLATTLRDDMGQTVIERASDSDPALVEQLDVMGYVLRQGGFPDTTGVTTWGRPFNGWHDGGIAVYNTNDGQSFRDPKYFWGALNSSSMGVEAGKLKVINMHHSGAGFAEDQYAGHQVVLLDNANPRNVLKRATFSRGTCTMDLGDVVWPADGITCIEVRFPLDDPMFPDGYIPESRTPHTPDASIHALRDTGVAFDCADNDPIGDNSRLARIVSSAYIAEGASGAIAAVHEPGASGVPDAGLVFPRYVHGYSWAESAYMGSQLLSYRDVVLGDPLMAPFYTSPVPTFVEPTPEDGSLVRGPVPLHVSVQVCQGEYRDFEVTFRVDSGSYSTTIETVSEPPYICHWDTGNWEDGLYTIVADVTEAGSGVVLGTTSPQYVVTNNGGGGPLIELRPEMQDVVDSTPSVIKATLNYLPSPAPVVKFWQFAADGPTMVGEGVPEPDLMTYTTSVTVSGQWLTLRAVAIESNGTVSFSPVGQIPIAPAGVPRFTTAGAFAELEDETEVYLRLQSVTAGTDCMGDILYVEDQNRVSGILVENVGTVSIGTGSAVAIKGTLRQNAELTERYLQAAQIWVFDPAQSPLPMPGPLTMTNRALGGKAPDPTEDLYVPGVDGGRGPYNVGLLVRSFGKVTYVDGYWFYIDDGCGLSDSNSPLGPYPVSLEGGVVPDPVVYPPVKGVLVSYPWTNRPGIGDSVTVTGISSIWWPGMTNPRSRCLLPRTQDDVVFSRSYLNCYKSASGALVDAEENPVGSDALVRMVDGEVTNRQTDHFSMLCLETELNVPIWAYTQLATGSCVTVTGVADSAPSQGIVADAVYLGGSGYGAMGMMGWPLYGQESMSWAVGEPGPVPATAEEMMASPAFIAQDTRPGCIGWALAQPDGTQVTLHGVNITGITDGGHCFALREGFEPEVDAPRLVLQLTGTAPGLTEWNQIDITGTLATLSSGQRAIVYPSAVYRWESEGGLPTLLMPKSYDDDGNPELWPWQTLVYPE